MLSYITIANAVPEHCPPTSHCWPGDGHSPGGWSTSGQWYHQRRVGGRRCPCSRRFFQCGSGPLVFYGITKSHDLARRPKANWWKRPLGRCWQHFGLGKCRRTGDGGFCWQGKKKFASFCLQWHEISFFRNMSCMIIINFILTNKKFGVEFPSFVVLKRYTTNPIWLGIMFKWICYGQQHWTAKAKLVLLSGEGIWVFRSLGASISEYQDAE